MLFSVLNIASDVARQLHPNIAEKQKQNQHKDVKDMMQFGYMHDSTCVRAGVMAQEMVAQGLVDKDDMQSVVPDQDILLSDPYVQLAWGELNLYLTRDWQVTEDMKCELAFWKRHEQDLHVLAHTSRIVYSIPVASSPLENDYSVAAQILTKWRSLLSPESFEMLTFISRELGRQSIRLDEVQKLSAIERENILRKFIQEGRPLKEIVKSMTERDEDVSILHRLLKLIHLA